LPEVYEFKRLSGAYTTNSRLNAEMH